MSPPKGDLILGAPALRWDLLTLWALWPRTEFPILGELDGSGQVHRAEALDRGGATVDVEHWLRPRLLRGEAWQRPCLAFQCLAGEGSASRVTRLGTLGDPAVLYRSSVAEAHTHAQEQGPRAPRGESEEGHLQTALSLTPARSAVDAPPVLSWQQDHVPKPLVQLADVLEVRPRQGSELSETSLDPSLQGRVRGFTVQKPRLGSQLLPARVGEAERRSLEAGAFSSPERLASAG